jgi:hypothetical protein
MVLWRAGYTPADRQTSWGVLHHPSTVPVYKLLLIRLITRSQFSAIVALSPAFISDFCFKFYSVHSIGYNFHSTFRLRFRLEINSFSPNSVFCWK